MEFLCSIFAVDLLTYTVLSNHCHLILRSRPDLVCSWTDWEVANRWWRLCPQRKDDSNVAAEPTDEEINMLTSDAAKMKELRQRLSDISWWIAVGLGQRSQGSWSKVFARYQNDRLRN